MKEYVLNYEKPPPEVFKRSEHCCCQRNSKMGQEKVAYLMSQNGILRVTDLVHNTSNVLVLASWLSQQSRRSMLELLWPK